MTGHFRRLSARLEVRGARRVRTSGGCCARDSNVSGPGMPESDTAAEGFKQSARRIKGRPAKLYEKFSFIASTRVVMARSAAMSASLTPYRQD